MGQCLGKCLGHEKKQPGGRKNPYHRQGEAGGGAPDPDAETKRQQALAAAEARAKDQQLRGVQGNKPKISSPAKDSGGGGGRNEMNLSDAAAWN